MAGCLKIILKEIKSQTWGTRLLLNYILCPIRCFLTLTRSGLRNLFIGIGWLATRITWLNDNRKRQKRQENGKRWKRWIHYALMIDVWGQKEKIFWKMTKHHFIPFRNQKYTSCCHHRAIFAVHPYRKFRFWDWHSPTLLLEMMTQAHRLVAIQAWWMTNDAEVMLACL